VAKINRIYADINCPFCFVLNEWLYENGLEDSIDWIGVEHEPYLTRELASTKDYSKKYQEEVSSCLLRADGVLLSPPPIRYESKNSLMALELVKEKDPKNFNKFKRAIYRAMWQDNLDISSLEVLKDIAFKTTELRLDEISNYDTSVDKNTKLWEDLGYDRIPMSLANTGAKYLGLGSKDALVTFISSGEISNSSSDACFLNQPTVRGLENSTLISNLLKFTLEPIFILDAENQIVLANNSATSLCNNRSVNDLLGTKIADHLLSFPNDLNTEQFVFKTSNHFNHKHWEIWSNSYSQNGDEYKILTWRDITELKSQNIELKEKNERLKQQDKDKDQFMAMISHELRTPLNCIIGFVDLLLESSDEETKDILERVSKSSNDLLVLVNDFLEFSKIKNSDVQFDNQPANLNNEINKIIESTSILAKENNCIITYTPISEELKNVKVDTLRLGQVLYNLIGNALKFTKNDNIEISLDYLNDSVYQFSIKDNGIGIPSDYQDDIFNPFNQGESTIAKRFGGTGLGLTVSKGIVENFGGRIWLESSENIGTTFFFSIPLDKVDQDKLNFGDNVLMIEDQLMAQLHPMNILLVEDNKTNQLLFIRYMEKLGYTPVIARDGEEAVELVLNNQFDIIFMDLYMPNMDGIDATKAIRKEYPKQALPICALTANDIQKIKEECFNVGMNDFITKPVSLKQIKKVLLTYLPVQSS